MTIKAVDLFCGVGGLTYGLQKAGIPVVAGIDIDDSCEYAYTHNNNCTFIHKSVEDVTGKEIRALLRGADVKILVGCAPCQPFSSHQKDKQNRSKHKDWKLLYQFGRLVEETRPHIVSMENVPELEKEKVFKDFVSTLEGLNYIVNYQVVNVANYGVPQRRKRLILLASRRKEIKLIDGSITGDYLSGRKQIEVPKKRRKPVKGKYIEVVGATEHNLKNINVKFPLGLFTCVTGVSGSGKSTLVNEILYKTIAKEINKSNEKPGKCKNIKGIENID